MTPPLTAAPQHATEPAAGIEPISILLVDNDPRELLAVGEIVSGLGVDVVKATSGLEALRLLLVQTFAVVVLDVRMPVMDGFEVAKFMRQLEKTKHTPIIFLTGSYPQDANQLEIYLTTGAADYLTKPVMPEILRSKITVFVDLARNALEKKALEKKALEKKALPLETAPVSILLVDDDPKALQAMEETLSDLEVHVVKASSGKAALRHLLAEPFAAVVLDVGMPVMDGFEVARFIRQVESTKHTPIIFLTGTYLEDDARLQAYLAGAADYLLKPAIPEILRSKINVFVDLARKGELAKKEVRLEAANRRLTELNALKDELLAKVSHELRTPLAVIKEGINAVADGLCGLVVPEQQQFLGMVDSNVDRLTGIIANLLDAAKIELGQIHLFRRRVNVKALLEALLVGYRRTAGQRTVTAQLADLPDVFADPDRVAQVVSNLVANAVKFTTDNGTVTVLLQQRRRGHHPGRWRRDCEG